MSELIDLIIKLIDKLLPVITLFVGALISFLSTYIVSERAYKRKLKEESEKQKREHIIKPIIEYLENVLNLSSRLILLPEDGPISKSDHEHIYRVLDEMPVSKARIIAISNKKVSTEFEELTNYVILLTKVMREDDEKEIKTILNLIVEKSGCLIKILLT